VIRPCTPVEGSKDSFHSTFFSTCSWVNCRFLQLIQLQFFSGKKRAGRVQMPQRSASAECSRAVGRRAARRTAPARARSAPDGAKTRGDNEQGGAHRHLHLAHRQTSTLLPRARRSMTASWARPRRPRRGRPADRCGFGRHTANKSAPEGVREQWSAGRGAGGRQRVHPPESSALAPTVPKPALCM